MYFAYVDESGDPGDYAKGGSKTFTLGCVLVEAKHWPSLFDRVIARQGDIGTGFFVVVDGRVRVVRDGERVATLGPGEFFGELSVIDGGPRNAHVVAEVPTRCLAIASWDFERVLLGHPALALTVLRIVVARLRASTSDHRY